MHYNVQIKLPETDQPVTAKLASALLISGDAKIIKAEKTSEKMQRGDDKQFDGGTYVETALLLLDSEFENNLIGKVANYLSISNKTTYDYTVDGERHIFYDFIYYGA